MVKINNIEELKKYLLKHDLNNNQIEEIIRNTMNLHLSKYYCTKDLIKLIDEYRLLPKPRMFLDIPDSEITIAAFGYTKIVSFD